MKWYMANTYREMRPLYRPFLNIKLDMLVSLSLLKEVTVLTMYSPSPPSLLSRKIDTPPLYFFHSSRLRCVTIVSYSPPAYIATFSYHGFTGSFDFATASL